MDYNDDDLDMLDNLMSNRIDRVPRHQRDRRAMMEKKQKLKRQVKKRKLVFLQSSPDYCRMNTTSGYKVSRKLTVLVVEYSTCKKWNPRSSDLSRAKNLE